MMNGAAILPCTQFVPPGLMHEKVGTPFTLRLRLSSTEKQRLITTVFKFTQGGMKSTLVSVNELPKPGAFAPGALEIHWAGAPQEPTQHAQVALGTINTG
jgi:hypothetical protein